MVGEALVVVLDVEVVVDELGETLVLLVLVVDVSAPCA